MPDIFDPYEERGVDHPHRPTDEGDMRPGQTLAGSASSAVGPWDDEDEVAWRDELAEIQKRRIRPGFYAGTDPPGT